MHIENESGLELIVEKPKGSPNKTPLLFVHGILHAAWIWQENFLPYFAKHNYLSYALSLQGHGKSKSSKRFRLISMKDYVTDINKTVKIIGTPPVIVGHSFGGLPVQKYLETHHLPAAILLASVPPNGTLRAAMRFGIKHPLRLIKINLTLSLYPMLETPEICKELLFTNNISNDNLERYQSLMTDEPFRAFLDSMLFNLPNPKKVKSSVYILGAEDDKIITKKEIELTAYRYNTKAEIFPGMTHDMMLNPGWKDAADRILDIIRSESYLNEN